LSTVWRTPGKGLPKDSSRHTECAGYYPWVVYLVAFALG
jgi:hypothetical protein